MELWIRSQDKKRLIKSEKLIIVEFTNEAECEIWNDTVKLGRYKNVERALEVLDEIQGYIKIKKLYELKEYDAIKTMLNGVDEIKASNNMLVYQMPED